ncbi:MAG TPA: ABC transporter permease, partial [Terriglobales bacterium]|nr:ABC transporter permease [Terriglobales bacterium]
PARILRQLLTESIVLASLGGVLGLSLARWGTAAAVSAVPTTIPRAEEIGLNLRVLLFTWAISVLTGVVFGLVPALKTCRSEVSKTLKDAARTVSLNRSKAQVALVIGEMAMAVVLLVGAGLMLRTLVDLWRVDPGFDQHHLLSFDITPAPSLADESPDAIRAVLREVVSTLRAAPEVEHVSLRSGARPLEGDDEISFVAEGQQPPLRQADLPNALEYVVEPEYLSLMRIPLLRGRFFTEADDERSRRVVVIDSGFRQKYFPGQDPIGKHLRVLDFENDPSQRTWIDVVVVGVVGHVKMWGLAEDALQPLQAQMYRPLMQGSALEVKDFAQGVGVLVRSRSSLPPQVFFETLRTKLLAYNREMIVSGNESEEEVVARSIGRQRFCLSMLGVFAGLALLLASVGIYGVLAYLVGQRTREIGVRMALGAQRLDVLRLVLDDGVRMTLAGLVLGVVAALGLTRLMASLLFGVTPTDPATFVAVAVVLSGIALAACYFPARRAARVDPMIALRHE